MSTEKTHSCSRCLFGWRFSGSMSPFSHCHSLFVVWSLFLSWLHSDNRCVCFRPTHPFLSITRSRWPSFHSRQIRTRRNSDLILFYWCRLLSLFVRVVEMLVHLYTVKGVSHFFFCLLPFVWQYFNLCTTHLSKRVRWTGVRKKIVLFSFCFSSPTPDNGRNFLVKRSRLRQKQWNNFDERPFFSTFAYGCHFELSNTDK